jgi:5'-methylthioadenosine/S-adenosylhomocysteine nucleosidase
MTLAVQFAMAAEAAPFLARRGLRHAHTDPRYGFQFHEGDGLVAAIAGTHPRYQVDSIGTISAALLTSSLLERYRPARLVNAGTAGGFEARGAQVGDVFLGAEVVVFHDRRIPLPGFEAMGRAHLPVWCDRALATKLGLKVGVVSTGDSLDCTPEDLAQLTALDAEVKEMEAASIAWVCERHGVPLLLLKAITDLVDHPSPTSEQFVQNLSLAVARLTDALEALVEHTR